MVSITLAIAFSIVGKSHIAIWMMVKMKTMIVTMSITFAIAFSPVWEAAHGNLDDGEIEESDSDDDNSASIFTCLGSRAWQS